MPFGDGTGPAGAGPMTGRGVGFCAGFNAPGSMNGGGGRGKRFFGGGRGGSGFGRGFRAYNGIGRQRFYNNQSFANENYDDPEAEKNYLKNQAEYLKESLDSISKRLEKLESKKD
jgi:hypothetical protein